MDAVLLYLVVFLSLLVNISSACIIRTSDVTSQSDFTDILARDLTELLRVNFIFEDRDQPDFDAWDKYLLVEWEVSPKVFGQYILTSHPDIELFSLGYFTLGIKRLDVAVESVPGGCLQNMTEDFYKNSILNLLFSNLKSSENQNGSALSEGSKVCFEEAVVDGKILGFKILCCSQLGNCEYIGTDWWQDFLFCLITVLNFIVFFYVANLVPEFLYKDKYGYLNFYFELDKCSHFHVVDKTADDIETDAELEIEALQKPKCKDPMTSLQEAVKGDTYSIKGIWFKAPENRLITKAYLPITLSMFLYQRLVQCTCYTYRGHATPPLRLRQLTAMRDFADHGSTVDETQNDFNVRICCDLPICNPSNRMFKVGCPKWSTVLRVFMTICSAFILAIPWIIIYVWDEHTIEGKRGEFAQDRNLIYSPPFYAFNLLRFIKITVPGLSIACMVIYVVCIAIVSAILQIDEDERVYVGILIRSALRNAKDRWDKGVIKSSRLLVTLFWPFKLLRNYGLIALLLWPFWIVLVCPFTVLIALLGNTPTINIFLRLLIVFIKDIVKIFTSRQIRSNTIKSVEKCILYVCLIAVLFIVHLLVFALVSLIVNIVAYTLVAAIVTAKATVRYTAFAVLVILNARDCFLGVEQRYAVFNEKLQAEILSQTQDKIKRLAKRQKEAQVNKAFRINVEPDEETEFCDVTKNLWHNLAISEKNKVLWNSKSVIQFLDDDDKLYLSEKFFFEACYMDYYGCPGDFASSLFLAVRQVLIISAFLAFVVFTLNAYGGLEANSSSGLLVTLATGLLPLFVRRFFSNPIPELSLDTTDYNFQNYLDRLILEFSEYWEVVDLDVEKLDKPTEASEQSETETTFWLKLGSNNSVKLAVSAKDDSGADKHGDVTGDDIEMVVVDSTGNVAGKDPTDANSL